MTVKPEIDALIRKVRVPEWSGAYWETFPKRVIGEIQKREETAPEVVEQEIPFPGSAIRWRLGLAAACVLVVLAAALWKGAHSREDFSAGQVAQFEKLFREVDTMFPNQVQAIVSDDQGVRLVLEEHATVPTSAPLLLKVCSPPRSPVAAVVSQHCQSIITFSGQRIQVDGEDCDVLTDAGGNVMVIGRRFFWSSAEPGRSTGVSRIQARMLRVSS